MHDTRGGHRTALLSLMRTAGAVHERLESTLAGIGLSIPKLAALSALQQAGNSLPLGQLAARLSCVKSNITQLVDRLEADGLVRRAPDPADRRARLAVLTPAGRAACREGLRIREDAERGLLEALGPKDVRLLAALLSRLERSARAAVSE